MKHIFSLFITSSFLLYAQLHASDISHVATSNDLIHVHMSGMCFKFKRDTPLFIFAQKNNAELDYLATHTQMNPERDAWAQLNVSKRSLEFNALQNSNNLCIAILHKETGKIGSYIVCGRDSVTDISYEQAKGVRVTYWASALKQFTVDQWLSK
ncbi:MAG: hypothetical protein WCE21_00805 [Candidatus Babeliales bacterium]